MIFHLNPLVFPRGPIPGVTSYVGQATVFILPILLSWAIQRQQKYRIRPYEPRTTGTRGTSGDSGDVLRSKQLRERTHLVGMTDPH